MSLNLSRYREKVTLQKITSTMMDSFWHMKKKNDKTNEKTQQQHEQWTGVIDEVFSYVCQCFNLE